MKTVAITLTLVLFTIITEAQKRRSYIKVPTPPKTAYFGLGPILFGAHAKAGVFGNYNTLFGVQAEYLEFFSGRREVGGFVRKYGPEALAPFFIQGAVSYGRFRRWNVDEDHSFNSYKISGSVGMDFRIRKLISIGWEAKVGRLTETEWWQPTIGMTVGLRLDHSEP